MLMLDFELTPKEKRKVGIKALLAGLFVVLGGAWFARRLASPALTIIIYHRVLPDDVAGKQPYIGVAQSAFREQLEFFKKNYRVVSLDEGVEHLRSGGMEQPMLAITFDDGYRDNLTLAQPVLAEYGLSATVFVTTGCVDTGQALWPDLVRAAVYESACGQVISLGDSVVMVPESTGERVILLKRLLSYVKTLTAEQREVFLSGLPKGQPSGAWQNLMLSWDETRALIKGGVSIGSHTVTHPILSKLEPDISRDEIFCSRERLERQLEQVCDLFAYPNGTVFDYSETHVSQLVAAGYKAAVTTSRGANRPGVDLFRLRRTGVYGTDCLNVIRAKLALEALMRS